MYFFKTVAGYRPFLPFVIPPSIFYTLTLIFGILSAYYGIISLMIAAAALGVLLTLAIKHNYFSLKKVFIFLLCFAFGAGRLLLTIHNRENLFPLYHVTLEGTVESVSFSKTAPWHYQITLNTKRIYNQHQWQKSPCTLSIYTYKKPHCSVSDLIHCSIDQIQLPKGDFKWYAYKEGIDASIFQKQITLSILKHPQHSFQRWISEKRKLLHIALSKKMKPKTFALFSSLFLGNRTTIKDDLEDQKPSFKLWGISHFLARSGLHLLIFIMILEKIISIIPTRFFFKQFFLLSISFIYFLFSWPSVSFNRAFYTFLFVKITALFALPLHSMHALAVVAFCILIKSPLQLFFLDFQLTFLLTLTLIWIAHTHHQRKILFTQKVASES